MVILERRLLSCLKLRFSRSIRLGGDLTGINILAEDEFPENLSQLALFPDLNDLSISKVFIKN
jgi:hypothetical protein